MQHEYRLIPVVAAVFLIGYAMRSLLQIELSIESIQAWVLALSWKGPLLYIGLVTFRQFLMLPSIILLPVGGLCFGALMGTVLGGAGIILSGVLKFGLARGLRRNWNGMPSH